MLSIKNFKKKYDEFELDCTMKVEEDRSPGSSGRMVRERVRLLRQFWVL